MTNNSSFLPQYTLNQLADRVAMKVDYISILYKADKVWDSTIELCKKIEAEPRDVSTVIVEVTKNTGIAVSGTSIRWYHVRLTLIYILLYYRHNDNVAYEKTVFPQLVKKMGAYANDKILKSKIQQEIENIKEEDKFLEQESLKFISNKIASIQPVPSEKDLADGRKKFIQAINSGLVEVKTINWADATIGFDRAVMKELFWGVENEELLRIIIKAIINTWDRLIKEKDYRCIEVTHSKGLAININPWKFGGITKETINKFFDDLWVERNARKVYNSVYSTKNTIENNRTQIDSLQQQKSISVNLELIEALKARNEELEKEKELWDAEREDLNAKIRSLENNSEWIGCFDGFLHSSLNPQAIAKALEGITHSSLPKKERGYWWVFVTVLTEIGWIPNTNYKLALQWANLHFNCGWDWNKDNQFKFTDINCAI